MDSSSSLIQILFAWRRLLIRATIVVAIASVIVSLLLPRWYTATATILPKEDSGGGGLLDLMGEIGANFGPGGGSAARKLLSRTPQVEMMMGVLKSRLIRGLVVDEFDLVDVYDSKTRAHAIKTLGKHLEVTTTPEGLLEIRVEDNDKERAANMANEFLRFLDEFNRRTSVEDARRTVEFIESRILENRARRGEAAGDLQFFQQENRAIEITEQTRVTVEALAELQAQRFALTIEKGVLEEYTTPSQVELQRLETQIREMTKAINSLQGDYVDRVAGQVPVTDTDDASDPERADFGVFLPLDEIPELALEFANLRREVLVQEKVYQFLASQLEEARLREARDQLTITVLDEAVPPIRKTRPRRSLIVILSTFLGFLAAAGVALLAESALGHLERSENDGLRGELAGAYGFLSGLRTFGRTPIPE